MGRKLPPTERRAPEILEAQDSWTKLEIRNSTRAWSGTFTQDMNGGSDGEERLQEVVWAWDRSRTAATSRTDRARAVQPDRPAPLRSG